VTLVLRWNYTFAGVVRVNGLLAELAFVREDVNDH
jgi:hypothetical protein